jgi:Protein of unknown function (DUF3352)
MLGAIGDRLRGAGYVLGDLAFVLARFPRAAARGIGGFWRSLPIVTRRRLVAAVGVVGLGLVIGGVVVPNLPCSLPGGDECPPENDALDLAPAGAIAYLHANFDPDTDQAERAAEVAARMPEVSRQVIGQLTELVGAGAPVGASTETWFGGEAAVVVLATGRSGDTVQLIEATSERGAARYAESIASGTVNSSAYRDIEVSEDGRGLASAVVDGFLVLGSAEGVRAVIDLATGAEGADSLADDSTASAALDELPEHRFAEAFLSRDGVEALVADADGPLATLEPFVDSNSSLGVAISLTAREEGLALASRSVLDPKGSKAEPGFFAAFEAFEPQLPEHLAADALAYLGIGQPGNTINALLRQATVRAPGIAAGFSDLIDDLRGVADVDLQRDLLESLGGEAAFAVVPRSAGRDLAPDGEDEVATLAPGEAETPYLEFLADDVDEEQAREALAKLQDPIARSVDTELGAPVFDERSFGDLEAHVLRLSPVAQLVYATYESKLAIANDLAAVQGLADDDADDLDSADRYQETIEDLPDEVALIAYLDLRGLLAFAERSGLAEDTAYAAFAPDLRRLSSLGLTVDREDDVLAADVRLLVD